MGKIPTCTKCATKQPKRDSSVPFIQGLYVRNLTLLNGLNVRISSRIHLKDLMRDHKPDGMIGPAGTVGPPPDREGQDLRETDVFSFIPCLGVGKPHSSLRCARPTLEHVDTPERGKKAWDTNWPVPHAIPLLERFPMVSRGSSNTRIDPVGSQLGIG